jgi:hypothetical protein
VHPNLSAYAHVYEHHDYNWHPFVSIGMEALVHDKPHIRRTYAEHCTKAFVLGTSTKHYQCWKFWTPTTSATRISGAAFFKHKYLTNPSVTPEGPVIAAAARLTNALQGINKPQLNTSTLQALGDLHDVFYKAANATNAPGKQVTNKEVKIWDQSPTKDRPNKEVEIWDPSPTKDRRVTFEPKFELSSPGAPPRRVASLPPCDSPLVPKRRNHIMSPLQSPCTPPRVQPNMIQNSPNTNIRIPLHAQ